MIPIEDLTDVTLAIEDTDEDDEGDEDDEDDEDDLTQLPAAGRSDQSYSASAHSSGGAPLWPPHWGVNNRPGGAGTPPDYFSSQNLLI